MEDLESHLLSCKRVRDFLKCFSATQWPRVVKATLLLGIQTLEQREGPANTTQLSIKDIEELVGKSFTYYDNRVTRVYREQLECVHRQEYK